MKQVRVLSVAFLLLLVVALPATATTLRVCADFWPPYNAEPGSERPGYMIEVLREIFEPQGVAIDYQVLPWTRAVDEVRNGRAAALVGTDQEENPGLVFPRENLGIHVNGFFVRGGNPWRFQGMASLSQVRLGVIDGYSYGSELDRYLASADKRNVFVATGARPLRQLLRLLAQGKLDVVAENVNVMTHTRRDLVKTDPKLASIEVAGYEFIDKCALYVGFSPALRGASDYASRFDEGIEQLRSSGRLKEILGKYGIRDWK